MVTNRKQHSSESRAKQASNEVHSDPNKIGASTPHDFSAKNLTPYGGLLPVATMLEKIGFTERIPAAGIPAQLIRYDGMIHGFFAMSALIDQGRAAIQQSAAALRTAFKLPPTDRF